MKEKNKIFTADDFARYHAGTMPPGEMHELERAVLEDPFLEDAMEGYLHAPAVEVDIADLKARLAQKQKKKHVFYISSVSQNKWWRIAALLLVMAGAGYLFYLVQYDKKNPLANNEIKASAEKKDNVETLRSDTATTKNDVAFGHQNAPGIEQKGRFSLPAPNAQIKREPAAPFKVEAVSGLISENAKDSFYSDSMYVSKAGEKKDTLVTTPYVLKGKLTDEEGNAIPYASITDNTRSEITVTDSAGRFLLRSNDSNITAIASAAGYTTKAFSLKKDVQPTIAMSKTNAELRDVAVNAMARRKEFKKSGSESKALDAKLPGVQLITGLLQPAGGKEKFNQYLKENLAPVYDENNELLTGAVWLSFTINKEGRPKNIHVSKSSCKDCEKEAIKLLENGPAWIGQKNETGTVVINF